jgi:hypothetical protein
MASDWMVGIARDESPTGSSLRRPCTQHGKIHTLMKTGPWPNTRGRKEEEKIRGDGNGCRIVSITDAIFKMSLLILP